MTPIRFHLCVALACAMLSVGAAPAVEPTSADLDVHQVKPIDTLAIVRALSGAPKIAVVDEDTIRVSGTPENLAIASVVVELLEQPTDGEQVTTRELADGTYTARVVLSHASLEEVATRLRAMSIRRYGLEEGTNAILVRDTKEQVQAALELIEALEQEASSR